MKKQINNRNCKRDEEKNREPRLGGVRKIENGTKIAIDCETGIGIKIVAGIRIRRDQNRRRDQNCNPKDQQVQVASVRNLDMFIFFVLTASLAPPTSAHKGQSKPYVGNSRPAVRSDPARETF
ncbi:hypothetical protein EVAR_19910_1 [Eumeta japonica]|uniref:Uncharacterized protein n=1 Tax=Eumeta variegata TaxID=151549 RepID=A0A4C1ZLG0_EUMVA|nr:hypothetical protein EVAR_19910_1 [Eumeta japonica]